MLHYIMLTRVGLLLVGIILLFASDPVISGVTLTHHRIRGKKLGKIIL